MKIDLETIIKLNKVIERDSLESSYKLALLKSLILTIKKFDHHIKNEKKYVKIPFYFVVEEWFFYYLPFVYLNIRQHKSKDLVLNKKIESLYKEFFNKLNFCSENDWKCMYAIIYKKYYNFEIDVSKIFREIRKLIVSNPMKYMGEISYQFFPKDKIEKVREVNRKEFQKFGYFAIRKEVYEVFKYLGDNFYGLNTILLKWEKLLNRINQFFELREVEEILTHNIDSLSRDTSEIRKLFENKFVFCVWSGKKINKFDVDHLFPFSVLLNNDYWNLLPASPKINNLKRDKIPSPEIIEKSKDRILEYWHTYKQYFKNFDIQRKISLGSFESEYEYIFQLESKSEFFIEKLGYESFELKTS